MTPTTHDVPSFALVAGVPGTLADGTITNLLVNWLTPTKERVTVVTGERGCFVADTLSADLTFYANADVPTTWEAISQFRGVSEGDMVRYAIAKPEPLLLELTAFRDAVLGRGADVVTMEEGTAAVAVAEALVDSARRGVTIALPQRAPASSRARTTSSAARPSP